MSGIGRRAAARNTVHIGGVAFGSVLFGGGASGTNSDRIDVPRSGMANIGAAELFIDFRIRPSANDADNEPIDVMSTGANYSGVNGNIIIDSHSEVANSFIVGLYEGQLYLSCQINFTGNFTLIGGADLRDGLWHHGGIYRDATSGLVELFVDGSRVASQSGATGSVAYAGGGNALDSVHAVCKEKYEAGGVGCNCALAEFRISNNRRINGATYSVPSSPYTTDANTAVLLHFGEQSGTTAEDSSGNNIDGAFGGTPTWSTDSPFAA